MYKQASNHTLYHEQHFNLLYLIKNYNPSSKSSFRKNKSELPYSNLIIWDIAQQQQTQLFSDAIANQEHIQRLLFEINYDEKQQSIVFNNTATLLNDKTIAPRPIKDKILIETYHQEAEKTHLWTASKQGKQLQKVAALDKDSTWHLDVGNQIIRLIKHHPTTVDITEFAW